MQRKIQKNNVVQVLEKLSLGENEALLYSVMLRHPKSTVQELATRSPFPRTMLYHVLNQLSQKGLVSASKDKWRTLYIAENPERLYELLAHKEKEFEKQSRAVREIIPELKNKYRLAGERPGVRIFEGIEEYKKALEDVIISRPKIILAYETLGKKKPGLEVRELHEYRRLVKKIQKNIIFFENKESVQHLAKRKYDDFTQFRNTEEEIVKHFDIDLMLYDDKILYTSYDEREPTAIIIEDKALYNMQQNLFMSMWLGAKDKTLAFSLPKK
ncbi:MAG: helix-turn-helix domain-containing protein [bacterium]|nr:helix-turn-helix domain-containing protein [bacterium]